MKPLHAAVLMIAIVTTSLVAVAQDLPTTTTGPATTAPAGAAAEVDSLRDALKTAYQRGDVEAMLKYLHPQVVITFPDGAVLEGRDALAGYYEKMLRAPGHRVQSYTSDPVVAHRYIHGDAVVSYGRMNDRYVLTDGTSFGLDSRFTVTVIRLPDGPPETHGWMIRSFHSSTDAFDNPVLHLVARKSMQYAGFIGILIGLIVGGIVSWVIRGRGRASAAAV